MNDRLIFNTLMTLFALLITHTYLSSFRQKNIENKAACYVTWFVYVLFQYCVAISDARYPLAILIINIILVTLIQIISCEGDSKTAIFRSGIFYATWMAIEVVSLGILLAVRAEDSFIVGNFVSKIFMYVTAQTYKRWLGRDNTIPIPFRYWIELFLVPASSILIIYNAYVTTQNNKSQTTFSIVSILTVLINYVIFDVYDKMGTQALIEKQNRAYEQEISLCIRQSAEREESYRKTRILRHDLKDRLIALNVLLEQNRTEDARKEIQKMLRENSLNGHGVAESGNLVLDALVNYKYAIALSDGIRMECCLEVPADLFVEGTDLCIILGNLLDNALEAVQKLPPEREKWINLLVQLIKGTLLITIENPYIGKIMTNSHGKIHSGKTGEHGIGLLSVERTAAKYGGEIAISYKEQIFRASVPGEILT